MNPTSCMFGSRFAIKSCLPIGWRTFIWWKIRQSAAFFWFWLRESRAVIQRTIDVSPVFLRARIGGKDCGLSACKPWSKQVGGWINFCMKRLKTLNSYQIFKIKNKESKTFCSWSPFQGLSNGTTLMQIHSGWTVPLSVSTLVRLKCFLNDQCLCIGQIEMFPQWPG